MCRTPHSYEFCMNMNFVNFILLKEQCIAQVFLDVRTYELERRTYQQKQIYMLPLNEEATCIFLNIFLNIIDI